MARELPLLFASPECPKLVPSCFFFDADLDCFYTGIVLDACPLLRKPGNTHPVLHEFCSRASTMAPSRYILRLLLPLYYYLLLLATVLPSATPPKLADSYLSYPAIHIRSDWVEPERASESFLRSRVIYNVYMASISSESSSDP